MLTRFKATNHPQQLASRGVVADVDDRRTPRDLFDHWAERYGPFTLDAAANADNALCPAWYGVEDDGLSQPWPGVVWCNPPYSACAQWVAKAWAEFRAGRAERVVMLLPANRTEQKWWQTMIEPHRDRPGASLDVHFLEGRIRFGHPPTWNTPAKGDRPPFGLCVVVWK